MSSVAMSSAIRALLVTEEEGEFDRAYRQALSEAADSLELTGVLDMLEHWCRRAINSTDPLSYRMDTVFGSAVTAALTRYTLPSPAVQAAVQFTDLLREFFNRPLRNGGYARFAQVAAGRHHLSMVHASRTHATRPWAEHYRVYGAGCT